MPSPSQRTAPSAADAARELAHRRHWRAGVRLTMALLAVWAVAGLGCGVLFADALADVRLGGFPLGFWFAQQGSILTFLLVVLVYAIAMAVLDRRHRRELAAIDAAENAS